MHGVSRWSNFPKNSRNRCHKRPRAASAAPRSRVAVSSPARMLPATLAPNRSSWSIRGNICEPQPAQREERPPPERQIELDFVDFDAELAEPDGGATAHRLDGRVDPDPGDIGAVGYPQAW